MCETFSAARSCGTMTWSRWPADLAWLAIGYLAVSVLLRRALGTASSITGGAAWARTGLRVTEPLTLPFVRHLVDGALAGTIVLTAASFQPGIAAATSGETATVSL